MEYVILEADSADEMQELVLAKLKDKWMLHGCLLLGHRELHAPYTQAMIKPDLTKPPMQPMISATARAGHS